MDKDLNKLSLHNYKPLREIVFESLREAIMEGNLKPGERLMEVQLAEKLGVSRTPVREAIRKLELEGLIIMVPRKGAYVADVSLEDILDVLEIRQSLEGLAAKLASNRITDKEIVQLKETEEECRKNLEENNLDGFIENDIKLHDIIFKATRNRKLITLSDSLREQVYRFRVTYMKNQHHSVKIAKEHENIVNSIENRDQKNARKYAELHIKLAKDFMLNQIGKSGNKKILKERS